MYAVPAAQWPSIAATIGTTPLIATCSRNSAPAPANVEPLVDWMRAPAESSSHTIGMRWRSASSRSARDLVLADRAHRAGHHREVVGRDRDRPAVDLADAGDRAVGREVAVAEAGVHVVGEQPVLDPRARDRAAGRAARARSACRASAGARRARGRPCRARAPCAPCEVADQRPPVVTLPSPMRSLAALPLRRALLGERGDALGRVLGVRGDREHALEVRERVRRRPSRARGRTRRGPTS